MMQKKIIYNRNFLVQHLVGKTCLEFYTLNFKVWKKNQRGFTLIYEVSKGLTKAKRSLGALFIFCSPESCMLLEPISSRNSTLKKIWVESIIFSLKTFWCLMSAVWHKISNNFAMVWSKKYVCYEVSLLSFFLDSFL